MSRNHTYNTNKHHDSTTNPIDYATQPNHQKNSHIRNPPTKDRVEHIFRRFCVNLNGLSITQHKNDFAEICHTMACFAADTICLTRHNLDTTLHITHQCLYQTTKATFDHTKLSCTSNPIPQPALTSNTNIITPAFIALVAQAVQNI